MQRWDAQAATGDPGPLGPRLPVAWAHAFLDFCRPGAAGMSPRRSASVHLQAADATGEWFVEWGDGGIEVRRDHAKGDAAARGTASNLLLVLWRRLRPDDVEVFGDLQALQRFLSLADLS